jgi:hypothetical protein
VREDPAEGAVRGEGGGREVCPLRILGRVPSRSRCVGEDWARCLRLEEADDAGVRAVRLLR